ncbi:class I SAM-dependent methyltransferase [Bradyrhizobium sp. U87765 SZCCT0131]|uniref:class I SAM-dependent methyltransferase n=1 Tax=unclassified Bradyrhizobium TaxID=2631580 RepID=UPI001BAC0C55|nr:MULTISPECIES: class I SAM-dependent methyltransferase [unclassified Bradyrhizobium]MBR1219994.1 class I SAM-dependent methyltransferase [Bradyrhizobium sp. U87765 SZCCT0131]MBR1263550.1 class I SAM-dependent methyltransferase [Bradyrhizobium sp. U87765 SZCCT0134]MBR1309119.1 class I SAM-dependent methyltransferase [Bradyrhizobium sp. U87765 SZCCT0110]MBR1323882.1 class I SAM-dependent methyltransferase [Bradyrhizobium sp. U87765 SZCCT0109]MBR1349434.1 class I SAM-dependent methyltransferase
MTIASDARFWDRASRTYASGPVADQAGYQRTLDRTSALLRRSDNVLELGCGTGTTALLLAGHVQAYLATDISAAMIAIADEKLLAHPTPGLVFRATTAEALVPIAPPFDAVLGFNYLHLVRDLHDTLRCIHALLAPNALFITKTPCVGDMNPLIRLVLPVMRAVGKAPYAGVFRATELSRDIRAAGFKIVVTETHATKGDDHRPYIVARKI